MEREALGCDGAGSHDATTAFATAIMVGAEVGNGRIQVIATKIARAPAQFAAARGAQLDLT